MPLFKKSTVVPTVSSLSPSHRKTLRRCRMVLIKDIDTAAMLDCLALDEGFRPEQREAILSHPSREARNAALLDRLETRDERAFSAFMDFLREHHRRLHGVVEEAARTIDETSQRERVAMSGDSVRRLLERNIRRARVENASGGTGGSDAGSVDGLVEDGGGDLGEAPYIDCYTLTTRGRMQAERWIKHARERGECSDTAGVGEEPEGVEGNEKQGEKTYSATLMADVMFRRVDTSLVRGSLRSDVPRVSSVWVVDREHKAEEAGKVKERSETIGSVRSKKRVTTAPLNGRSQVPPPVPPKPEHLPPFRRPPASADDPPPILKSRKLPPAAPEGSPRIPSPSTRGAVKPPVPLKKPAISPAGRALLRDEKLLVPAGGLVVANGAANKKENGSGSGTTGRPPLNPGEEEDYNLLNYNISACSVAEFAYDTEKFVDHSEKVLESGEDPAYEPIDKPGERLNNGLISAGTEGMQNTKVEVEQALPTYSLVDVEKKTNRHLETSRGCTKMEASIDNAGPVVQALSLKMPDITTDIESCTNDHDDSNGNPINTNEVIDEGDSSDMVVIALNVDSDTRPSICSNSDAVDAQDSSEIESICSVRQASSTVITSPLVDPITPRNLNAPCSPKVPLNSAVFRTHNDPILPKQKSLSDPDLRGGGGTLGLDMLLPAPPTEPLLPRSSMDVGALVMGGEGGGEGSSSDDSFCYEEIDGRRSPSQRSSATYLDPRTSIGYARERSEASSRAGWRRTTAERDGRRLLTKDTLLVASSREVTLPPTSLPPEINQSDSSAVNASDSSALQLKASTLENDSVTNSLMESGMASGVVLDAVSIVKSGTLAGHHCKDMIEALRGTTLAYSREGELFFVPTSLLSRYGNPNGEPWFYPVAITARQATLFLSEEHTDGCFLVYRPAVGEGGVRKAAAAYNLSVCRDGRGSRDVVHYRIVENVHGDLMVDGHDHSFMALRELVVYFQRNKSSLATRLRRPLREARLPITPGYHYPARYEIDVALLALTGRIIGKGYFGVVCGGTYQGAPVAVKVLQRPESSLAEEEEFMEEARTMMGLKHDNVVRLVGVRCTTRPMFIVTEFMSRGSLKEYLRSGSLPTDSIDALFSICVQVVSAMQYLESLHYILHRDLAARNFLVAADLGVKLADFGRARLVCDDAYQAARIEKICIKWASPEVLIDSAYSTKSDVWAAGVVFWEIFSGGERPFSSLSGEQTAVYVTEGGRLDKPHGCPPDLYALMKSCWRDSPRDRPSFAHLSDKLARKSSVYYHRPTPASAVLQLGNESGRLGGVSAPHGRFGSPQGRIESPPVRTKLKLPVAASGKSSTPGATRRPAISPTRRMGENYSPRDLIEGDEVDYRNDVLPRSASDASLHSYSGGVEEEGLDLTRGDRLRKSLGKLMKMNNYKVKKNGSGGTPTSAKVYSPGFE